MSVERKLYRLKWEEFVKKHRTWIGEYPKVVSFPNPNTSIDEVVRQYERVGIKDHKLTLLLPNGRAEEARTKYPKAKVIQQTPEEFFLEQNPGIFEIIDLEYGSPLDLQKVDTFGYILGRNLAEKTLIGRSYSAKFEKPDVKSFLLREVIAVLGQKYLRTTIDRENNLFNIPKEEFEELANTVQELHEEFLKILNAGIKETSEDGIEKATNEIREKVDNLVSEVEKLNIGKYLRPWAFYQVTSLLTNLGDILFSPLDANQFLREPVFPRIIHIHSTPKTYEISDDYEKSFIGLLKETEFGNSHFMNLVHIAMARPRCIEDIVSLIFQEGRNPYVSQFLALDKLTELHNNKSSKFIKEAVEEVKKTKTKAGFIKIEGKFRELFSYSQKIIARLLAHRKQPITHINISPEQELERILKENNPELLKDLPQLKDLFSHLPQWPEIEKKLSEQIQKSLPREARQVFSTEALTLLLPKLNLGIYQAENNIPIPKKSIDDLLRRYTEILNISPEVFVNASVNYHLQNLQRLTSAEEARKYIEQIK